MGKIERQLFYLGLPPATQATTSLLEPINLAYVCEHDLGPMQQAYFELALLFVVVVGQYRFNPDTFHLEPILVKQPPPSTSRRSSATSVTKASRDKEKKDSKDRDSDKEKEEKGKGASAGGEHAAKKVLLQPSYRILFWTK